MLLVQRLRDFLCSESVYIEYRDEGTSARTDQRPSFQEMIADAKANRYGFDAILVWKFSRFARNFEDATVYKSLLRKKCGIGVISFKEPIEDSPIGRLLENIIGAIDEFYSANLAEDCMRGMRENARRGFFNGGNLPIGYQRKMITYGEATKTILAIDEQYAPVVKRIYQLLDDFPVSTLRMGAQFCKLAFDRCLILRLPIR
ncbi:MAG: recombinase family protein [Armatimonadota bacterium]